MSYYPVTGNITAANWHQSYTVNTTSNWSSGNQNVVIQGQLRLDEGADIRFGDASLMETLREIQSQLGMLTPDPKLEKEFEELRACAQEYERLRAKFLEQKRMWEILKQDMIDQ